MQQINSLIGPKVKLVIVGTVKRQTKMALMSFILLLFFMEVYNSENYSFFFFFMESGGFCQSIIGLLVVKQNKKALFLQESFTIS